ncbi:hypothetical protein D3C72_1119100 [compost metagenome]
MQHVDATPKATLGIAGSINQAEPTGRAEYVERSGDGLARCLHAAGAGGQVGLQILVAGRLYLAFGDQPAQHLPSVALQRRQPAIKQQRLGQRIIVAIVDGP